jgi:hypothetical protein
MSDNMVPKLTTEQAEVILRERLRGRVWQLHVIMTEERLILQGFAGTYYAKQLAQHLAMQTIGIAPLCNEIEVRPELLSSGSGPWDET